MKKLILNLLPFLIIIQTSACGYTLRGNLTLPNSINKISIISDSYSQMSLEINTLLKNMGIEVSENKLDTLYQVNIISEEHNKRILTINQSGTVNEYELIYTINFSINTPDGEGRDESITLYRDYSFDESRILGTSDRETAIKNEMVSTASTMIIYKIKAKAESM